MPWSVITYVGEYLLVCLGIAGRVLGLVVLLAGKRLVLFAVEELSRSEHLSAAPRAQLLKIQSDSGAVAALACRSVA